MSEVLRNHKIRDGLYAELTVDEIRAWLALL